MDEAMKPYLPKRAYAGYIFDCDGTLADSMPLHHQAWINGIRAAGGEFDFSYEQLCQWGGVSIAETVENLEKMFHCTLDVETVREGISEYILEHLPRVKPREHIVAIAQKLAQEAPVSVASGGDRLHVNTSLRAIGIKDIFKVIVTADDVKNSKPAPDLFLLAAKGMGVDPKDCLVYEDSPMGIQAAEAAGMDSILVPAS